jgi:hypothetical protein
MRPVVDHASTGMFLESLAQATQFWRQPQTAYIQRRNNFAARFC